MSEDVPPYRLDNGQIVEPPRRWTLPRDGLGRPISPTSSRYSRPKAEILPFPKKPAAPSSPTDEKSD